MLFPFIPVARAGVFGPGDEARQVNLPNTVGLRFLLANVIKVALALAAVIALGFIVYGGFKYITARGDETTIEEAKRTIAGGVIGIVVIGIAYAIVAFVAGAVFS